MTTLQLPRPALSPSAERQILQIVIAIAGFAPVGLGLAGAMLGATLVGDATSRAGDGQMRFLSGLLLGIGFAYWEAVPQIEVRAARIRLLTSIVMLGGFVSLIGIAFIDGLTAMTAFGLVMELVVAPLVCFWQTRIARRFGTAT